MERFICVACGTQYREGPDPPDRCPICLDPRQYVPPGGQRWTTLEELRATHRTELGEEAGLATITTQPHFAIGQRAVLVPWGDGLLLWDCVALLDDATAAEIDRRGGLRGIAISHPHYYTTMVEWAERFGCPVHLHAADARWVMRPNPAIDHWDGERLNLGDGLTLVRGGGHFPGGTMLHRAEGAGTLLSGDIVQVVPDRSHVAFMWSYPNYVPLPEAEVRRVAASVDGLAFETIVGAFPGTVIESGGREVLERSVERYARAVREVL